MPRQFRVTIFERGEMDGHWVQRLKSALIESVLISFSIFLKKGMRETSSDRKDVSLIEQTERFSFHG